MRRLLSVSVAALVIGVLASASGSALATDASASYSCGTGDYSAAPGLLDGALAGGVVTCGANWIIKVDTGAIQQLNQIYVFGPDCSLISDIGIYYGDDSTTQIGPALFTDWECDNWYVLPFNRVTRYVYIAGSTEALVGEVAISPAIAPPGGVMGPNLTWAHAVQWTGQWLGSSIVNGVVVTIMALVLGYMGIGALFNLLAPTWWREVRGEVVDWFLGYSSKDENFFAMAHRTPMDAPYKKPTQSMRDKAASTRELGDED